MPSGRADVENPAGCDVPCKAIIYSRGTLRNVYTSCIASESRSSLLVEPNIQSRVNVQEAVQALKNIESYRGKTANRDITLCNNYAIDVLGHKHFAPWLYVYAAPSETFKEGWMPDNYYGSVVVRKLEGRY